MENSSFFPNATQCYSVTSEPTVTKVYLEVPHIAILCSVLGVASTVGTLGNTLVLLSIIKFDSLRDIPDLFIFSLSLSDLLVTSVYQPFKFYRLVHLQEISWNMTYIQFSTFLGHLSLIASITNMFGLTVERLISIRFPLRYDLLVTRTRAVLALTFLWIFCLACGALVSWKRFLRLHAGVLFLLLIAGTVLIYIYLYFVAKRLEAAMPRNGSLQGEQRLRSPRGHKAAKSISIILGVALSCWLPFLIGAPQVPSLETFLYLQTLSVCNSSINPYVYCARSRRYYEAFLKLLGLRRLIRATAPVVPTRDPISRPRDLSSMKVLADIPL